VTNAITVLLKKRAHMIALRSGVSFLQHRITKHSAKLFESNQDRLGPRNVLLKFHGPDIGIQRPM
jgi:hypothetical protein